VNKLLGNKILAIIPLILLIGIIPAIAFADSQQTNKESIFELLVTSPERLLSELAIPDTSAGDNLQPELITNQISCKSGLNLVIKASDRSPACVKPTSIYKLIERNWMLVREAFAQTDEAPMQTDQIQSDVEHAMAFSVRASGGQLEREIIGNFHKFTPFTSQEPHITPDNPVDERTSKQFAVESLPSKANLDFYRLVGKIMQQEPIAREPFDVNVDVESGDGTVLQTWAYTNCQIQNYVTYLQDTVFFYQFSGKEASEIRDRTTLQCSGLELEVP